MKTMCKVRTGKFLPEYLFNLGYTQNSEFTITAGQEYEVFGMALWKGTLAYLISNDAHLPNWIPVELFTSLSSRIPEGWSFRSVFENGSSLQAVWGYDRLIFDPGHYDGLLEREVEALRYFYAEEGRRLKPSN